LRKDNCLEAIEEKPEGITNKKWKEIDNNAIANLHLALAYAVLSSIVEKTTAKEIWILSQACTRLSHFTQEYS